MLIIAWESSGSVTSMFDEDIFRHVLSIFVTYSFLTLLTGMDGMVVFRPYFLLLFSLVIKKRNSLTLFIMTQQPWT